MARSSSADCMEGLLNALQLKTPHKEVEISHEVVMTDAIMTRDASGDGYGRLAHSMEVVRKCEDCSEMPSNMKEDNGTTGPSSETHSFEVPRNGPNSNEI